MLHERYMSNLEAARQFEDFVSDIMYESGMPIHIYRSKTRQVKEGESRAGLEVKLDRRWRETGNLFIETAERWNSHVEMRAAGIHGNNWLFAIGDYDCFWLFATSTLRNLERHCETRDIATAVGFLLKTEHADKWAARKYETNKEKPC